jgi:molybdopterin-guanine dinucleotide biosynthesis protein B
MVRRALNVLKPMCPDVVVVSSRPVPDAGAPVVPDVTAEAGPLGGLEAALLEAKRRDMDGVLLLACDLPLMSRDVVGRVAQAAEGRAAVAPERSGGGVEPLCAAYSIECLDAVRARLASDDRSLHGLFTEVGGTVLPPLAEVGDASDAFFNVNTPEDRDRAEAFLSRLTPLVVCVIGKKKSGKTSTSVGLIRELIRRGHCVMSAKHGHGFELDTEGSDSWRHRHQGGARRVAMAGPDQVAIMGGWDPGGEQPLEALVRAYLGDARIVIAEGFKTSSFPKIEVYRRAAHPEPLYGGDPERDGTYLAMLTDVPGFQAHVPVMDLHDETRFTRLADLIESHLSREEH